MPTENKPEGTNENSVEKFVEMMGVAAEVSLIFYRGLMRSGATPEEADVLLRAFIWSWTHRDAGAAGEQNSEGKA